MGLFVHVSERSLASSFLSSGKKSETALKFAFERLSVIRGLSPRSVKVVRCDGARCARTLWLGRLETPEVYRYASVVVVVVGRCGKLPTEMRGKTGVWRRLNTVNGKARTHIRSRVRQSVCAVLVWVLLATPVFGDARLVPLRVSSTCNSSLTGSFTSSCVRKRRTLRRCETGVSSM